MMSTVGTLSHNCFVLVYIILIMSLTKSTKNSNENIRSNINNEDGDVQNVRAVRHCRSLSSKDM